MMTLLIHNAKLASLTWKPAYLKLVCQCIQTNATGWGDVAVDLFSLPFSIKINIVHFQ